VHDSTPVFDAERAELSRLAPVVSGYIRRTNDYDGAVKAFQVSELDCNQYRETAKAQAGKLARRGREFSIVGGAIIGLAAASRFAGESLSPLAWTMATLAPALMFSAKTWAVSGQLLLVDAEAERVRQELQIMNTRRYWQQRAIRLVNVLGRRLETHAGLTDLTLPGATELLTSADQRLVDRIKSPNTAQKVLGEAGWGDITQILRRSLAAGVVAAAINSAAFGLAGRAAVAITCGVAASVLAVIRYYVSYLFVDQRRLMASRLALWCKQRSLLAEPEQTLRTEANRLIALYQAELVVDLRN
jgi:hypothetical protein